MEVDKNDLNGSFIAFYGEASLGGLLGINFDIQMDGNCSSDLVCYELLLYGDEVIREL